MNTVKQKAIASARAIIPKFDLVVELCDLVSVDGWHRWSDEENNILHIKKDRKIEIYPCNKDDSTKVHTYDLYRKGSFETILKHSYWCMAAFGKVDSVLWLLGVDGRLRVCCFSGGSHITNQPPLLSGIGILKLISARYLEDEPKVVRKCLKTKFNGFNEIEETWTFGLPRSDELGDRVNCLAKIR